MNSHICYRIIFLFHFLAHNKRTSLIIHLKQYRAGIFKNVHSSRQIIHKIEKDTILYPYSFTLLGGGVGTETFVVVQYLYESLI